MLDLHTHTRARGRTHTCILTHAHAHSRTHAHTSHIAHSLVYIHKNFYFIFNNEQYFGSRAQHALRRIMCAYNDEIHTTTQQVQICSNTWRDDPFINCG